MTKPELKCPSCLATLVVFGQGRLETLDSHVSQYDPPLLDKYQCPEEDCMTRASGVFWNMDGELYIVDYPKFRSLPEPIYVENNNGPFGSISRQINVEIYKKDENFHWLTLPTRMPSVLSGMKINVVYHYQSDKDGHILKRKRTLEYVRKDNCGHIWGIRMVKHLVKALLRDRIDFLECKSQRALRNIKITADMNDMPNPEWWRKFSAVLAKFVLRTMKKEVALAEAK